MKLIKIFFLLLCAASIIFSVSCCVGNEDPPEKLRSDLIEKGKYVATPGYTYQVCYGVDCEQCYYGPVLDVKVHPDGTKIFCHYTDLNSFVVVTDPCIYRQVRVKNGGDEKLQHYSKELKESSDDSTTKE